jgi:FixJ family two-component response regulator
MDRHRRAGLVSDKSWSKQVTENIFISIVDDDKSVGESLVSLMQSHGFIAAAFESAASYLAAGIRTDCLIADVHMPGMSGLELCSRLAELGRSLPTILITARGEDSIRERSLKLGVSCYLTKPFREETLMNCIRTALKGRGAGGKEP